MKNQQKYTVETVLEVKHFSDKLFFFKVSKSWNTEWIAGQFTMIGMDDGGYIMRAYSIASTPEDNYLEFLSIAVPDGPLTSKLVNIKPGDKVRVNFKPKGTLTLTTLDIIDPVEINTPDDKRRLWMISTGTGLAPFLSIARDSTTFDYDLYDEVIVTHSARTHNELVLKEEIESKGALLYQTVTREAPKEGIFAGRITDHIKDGRLFKHFGMTRSFDPKLDRVLICGNQNLNIELMDYLESLGFVHGTMSSAGQYTREKAFVDQIDRRR